MGNTIQKDSSTDRRFGDSLLAREIKNIMTEQKATFRDKVVNINVAKACCRDVIKPDISNTETKNVVSIAFPKATTGSERCKKEGICLETEYVGYQINGDRNNYCKQGTKVGDVDMSITRPGVVGYSSCDGFMIDYCAKSLYEQGCIRMDKNSENKLVPQFSNYEKNKMCWTYDKKMNYGPPECTCLNSAYGPNLNTNPSNRSIPPFGDSNPYGLDGINQNGDNTSTKYSLNIFAMDPTEQFPVAIDARCTKRSVAGDDNMSAAYTLGRDSTGQINICINSINVTDSNINEANFSDIKQDNICGPNKPQKPSKDDVPVNPDKKLSDAQKAEVDKKILEEAAAKKKVEEEARNKLIQEENKAKAALEAKKVAEEQAKAKMIEEENKTKAALEAKKKADEELETMKKEMEKLRQKNIEEKIQPAISISESKPKAGQEQEQKIPVPPIQTLVPQIPDIKVPEVQVPSISTAPQQLASSPSPDGMEATEKSSSNLRMLLIGGGIFGIIIIMVILFFLFRSSSESNNNSASSDDSESTSED